MSSPQPIRPAVASDVPALAALARQTFHETFVEELAIPYPPDDLQRHYDKTYSLEATQSLLDDPALRVWVAEADGELLGYAVAGPCGLPHAEARPVHGELWRLYVARSAHGHGTGRALLDAAMGWLREQFPAPLWLGVWSGNLRAQAIYEKRGFRKVGEYDYPVGQWIDREFIYRLD